MKRIGIFVATALLTAAALAGCRHGQHLDHARRPDAAVGDQYHCDGSRDGAHLTPTTCRLARHQCDRTLP